MTTAQEILYNKLDTLGTAYPLVAPANASYPAMVYQKVGELPMRSHSGASLRRHRFQIACWGRTYAEAVTLAESVYAALNLNQTGIELITAENAFEDAEPETGLYRSLVEVYVWNP